MQETPGADEAAQTSRLNMIENGEQIKQPWERQEGESVRDHRRFLVYRNQGTGRSVRKAAEINKLSKKAQFGTWQSWTQIAHRGKWAERARAWDEYQEYEQRKADLVAEQAAREKLAAERIHQRALLSEEAVTLRAIFRTLAARAQEILSDPVVLAQLKLHRSKAVRVVREGQNETRTELQHPGLLEILNLVAQGTEVGGKLWRLAALDQPDESGEKQPEERARELGAVIAEQLLGTDLATLLSLKAELAGMNGKVRPDGNADA